MPATVNSHLQLQLRSVTLPLARSAAPRDRKEDLARPTSVRESGDSAALPERARELIRDSVGQERAAACRRWTAAGSRIQTAQRRRKTSGRLSLGGSQHNCDADGDRSECNGGHRLARDDMQVTKAPSGTRKEADDEKFARQLVMEDQRQPSNYLTLTLQ